MRVFINWGRYMDTWSFPLANIWWSDRFFGLSILGIAVEWSRPRSNRRGQRDRDQAKEK